MLNVVRLQIKTRSICGNSVAVWSVRTKDTHLGTAVCV